MAEEIIRLLVVVAVIWIGTYIVSRRQRKK